MLKRSLFFSLFSLFFFCISSQYSFAQNPASSFVFGDLLPDAPELSSRGHYAVGAKTLEFTNKDQIDVEKSIKGDLKVYDRNIKVEIWYPSTNKDTTLQIEYTGNYGVANDPKRPLTPFTFKGRASRDAEPNTSDGRFPLVIFSHGYFGSRTMFSYLTENLASKGYIVVSIDHPGSTFQDPGKVTTSLFHRPLDILFVLGEIANLAKEDSNNFLSGLVDVENTALIGYSMGGYGVLNVAGAGFSRHAAELFNQMTEGSDALMVRTAGNSKYIETIDPRIKAVVAFAPWGMEHGVWNTEGLEGLKIPTFIIAGSQDDISGYEKGVKAIFDSANYAKRYLLTYKNARHNIAQNPPPFQSVGNGFDFDEYLRFAEPAWDERRINNINQHFITAFLGIYLKNLDYGKYLELNQVSEDALWTGFKPRTSVGMEFRHTAPLLQDKK